MRALSPPSLGIRELRGRHLRQNNQQITDIDALLEVDDTLVLVSCKRIELGREYDADY